MAITKVSDLTAKATPSGSEELLINDGGTSKKITIANLPDTNTTYTAGTGITLAGTTFNVDVPYTSAEQTKVSHLSVTQAVDLDTMESKLAGIEASATADQTGAEIKTAYEAQADTNAFTDADHSKLDGIAASANNYSHPTGAGNEHLPATVSQTEAGYLDGVTSAIQTQLDGKSSTSHNHDSDYVSKTSATGSASLPSGTTAQRDGSPSAGYIRYNTTTGSFEGYSTAWGSIGGGATGGGSDDVFYENAQTVTASYTLTTNKNAMSAGPLTINTGVTVTVPTGATWHVL